MVDAVATVPTAREGIPRYVAGPKPSVAWAHFADGSTVQVFKDRRRSYPGLVGEAPPTSAFYRAAGEALRPARSVVDMGCGAGVGTQILARDFDEVVGIDCDREALAFAERFAPAARYARSAEDIESPDAAVLVDVLGCAALPLEVLRSIRRRAKPDARVLVAEPAAYASQVLRPPARRAFTRRGLSRLLASAGYEVETWLADRSTFHCCVAKPIDDTWQHLASAEASIEAGDSPAALRALELAAKGKHPVFQVEVALAKASLAFALGDGDTAARAYFQARELDRSDSAACAGLARIALATGARDDALSLAIEAARTAPCNADAVATAALVTEETGSDALDGWRVAANLAPDDLGIAIRLAQAASVRNDHDYAVRALERVRAYGDDHGAPFHVTLAWLLVAAGRAEDAKLEARIASSAAPDDEAVLELCRHLELG